MTSLRRQPQVNYLNSPKFPKNKPQIKYKSLTPKTANQKLDASSNSNRTFSTTKVDNSQSYLRDANGYKVATPLILNLKIQIRRSQLSMNFSAIQFFKNLFGF